jgi:hypothetical protein
MGLVAPGEDKSLALVPGTYELVLRPVGRDEQVLPLQVTAGETTVRLP